MMLLDAVYVYDLLQTYSHHSTKNFIQVCLHVRCARQAALLSKDALVQARVVYPACSLVDSKKCCKAGFAGHILL